MQGEWERSDLLQKGHPVLETCYWMQSIPVPKRLTVNQFGLYYPFQIHNQRIGSPCRSVIPAPHRCFIHKKLEKVTIKPCYKVVGVREFYLLLLKKKVKWFISVKLVLCSHEKCHIIWCVQLFLLMGIHYQKSGDISSEIMSWHHSWWSGKLGYAMSHILLSWLWVALLKSIVITSIKISGTTCISKISKIWPKGWLITMFLISHFHKF